MVSDARRAAEAFFTSAVADAPAQDEMTLRQLFGDTTPFKAKHSTLPDQQFVGNIVVIRMGNINPKFFGNVPALIWGIYRGADQTIQALDVITLRKPRGDRSFPYTLPLNTPELYGAVSANRPVEISMSSLLTIPYTAGEKGFIVRSSDREQRRVDPALLPDLLVRRVLALYQAKTVEWDANAALTNLPWLAREGFQLPLLQVDNIRNGMCAGPEAVQFKKSIAATALHPKEIQQLTYYAVNAAHHSPDPFQHIDLPEPGQNPLRWANWSEWSQGLVGQGFQIWPQQKSRPSVPGPR